MRSGLKAWAAVLVVSALAISGCTSSDDSRRDDADALVAAVASYDIVANRPARFIVGLYSADQSRTLAYGTVKFILSYLGNSDGASRGDQDSVGPINAGFLPIPGQEIDPDAPRSRLVSGSEATGVYAAPDVAFEQAGFWEVAATAQIDGRTETATAAFEVRATSDIPAVGEPAPRTRQPLIGDRSVDPKSIDSRAGDDTPIPDPELHDITVADAIAAGRPAMVVVSTPTFCVSRFCGPITDTVHELALQNGHRMDFIHLEVWQDFAANKLNPAAADWIAPTPETEGGEPWVFVIDANGNIFNRFDNVASEIELVAAVETVIEHSDG